MWYRVKDHEETQRKIQKKKAVNMQKNKTLK